MEEVAGEGVAVAVLDDEQPAAVAGGGMDMGGTGVAAHEGAVGLRAAVLIGEEEGSVEGVGESGDGAVLAEGVADVGGDVVGVEGHVVDELLRVLPDGGIAGELGHGAHELMDGAGLVVAEVEEGHAGCLGKGFGTVVSAEGKPVVVGAGIDLLTEMGAEHAIGIDDGDVGAEAAVDVLDDGFLAVAPGGALRGAVELYGGGDEHAVDAHVGAEGFVVAVEGSGIVAAAGDNSAEGFHGAYVAAPAGDDDAVLGLAGYLRHGGEREQAQEG